MSALYISDLDGTLLNNSARLSDYSRLVLAHRHDRKATKDQAARILMEAQGLGQRQLVVFGDHLNDLKFFDLAGEAVAVDNAVPELKARADRVIGSNEDDSVVKFIRRRAARDLVPDEE